MSMTLGSLFDGIGGWQLAAVHTGVIPIWSSEIDSYPAAVTAYHFPDTIQLGDITKIDGAKITPVDIICAGSPCQNLSQAGNKKGLRGAESSLFYHSVRILREMRRKTHEKYPRYFVWENVPGAYTSNSGADFKTVLEEIGQTEIPMPKYGKWATAGMVELPSCSIAWRTLDAQYWGVPQRRRRIFLIASFGTARVSAGKILFEPESLQWNTLQSGGEERKTSGEFKEGTENTSHIVNETYDIRLSSLGTNKASARYKVYPTTTSRTLSTCGVNPDSQQGAVAVVDIYDMTHADEPMRPCKNKGVIPTLQARMGTGGNQVPVLHYDIDANKTVRKLTPVECERLQGLPDGYTDIIFKNKPASDAKRYKALGNGMAQPCADFIISRIVEMDSVGV